MSLPAIDALIAAGLSLKIVARPGSAEIYRNRPEVLEVINETKGLAGRLAAVSALYKENFGRGLILPNSFSSALVPFLARVPNRVGFARNLRSLMLSKAVPVRRRDLAAHQSFYFLKLVEAMGIPAPFTRPLVLPPPVPEPELPEGFRLALAPGAAFGSAKRWPAEKFARTAELILSRHPGSAVILGGPSEVEAARQVEEELTGLFNVVNLAGRTTLAEAISVLSRCHLTVANDSGLMHLSGALDVPVVAVFGPTNPLTTAPMSRRHALLRIPVDCAPCQSRECPKRVRICFEDLTPQMAAEAAERLLAPFQTGNRAIFWTPTQDEAWPSVPLPRQTSLVIAQSALLAAGHQDLTPPPGTLIIPRPLLENRDHQSIVKKYDLNPASSFWLGDTPESLTPAVRLGGRTVLLMTDRAQNSLPAWFSQSFTPDLAAPDPGRAFEWINSLTS
jgi:heptosyltransferase-2